MENGGQALFLWQPYMYLLFKNRLFFANWNLGEILVFRDNQVSMEWVNW